MVYGHGYYSQRCSPYIGIKDRKVDIFVWSNSSLQHFNYSEV